MWPALFPPESVLAIERASRLRDRDRAVVWPVTVTGDSASRFGPPRAAALQSPPPNHPPTPPLAKRDQIRKGLDLRAIAIAAIASAMVHGSSAGTGGGGGAGGSVYGAGGGSAGQIEGGAGTDNGADLTTGVDNSNESRLYRHTLSVQIESCEVVSVFVLCSRRIAIPISFAIATVLVRSCRLPQSWRVRSRRFRAANGTKKIRFRR